MVRLRRRLVFGGRPAAALSASLFERSSKLVVTRMFLNATAHTTKSVMAVTPMTRHHPLVMSVLAGSFKVE